MLSKRRMSLTISVSSSRSVCLRKRMTAYSTSAPNTNRMQANIQASMAVKPEKRSTRSLRLNFEKCPGSMKGSFDFFSWWSFLKSQKLFSPLTQQLQLPRQKPHTFTDLWSQNLKLNFFTLRVHYTYCTCTRTLFYYDASEFVKECTVRTLCTVCTILPSL